MSRACPVRFFVALRHRRAGGSRAGCGSSGSSNDAGGAAARAAVAVRGGGGSAWRRLGGCAGRELSRRCAGGGRDCSGAGSCFYEDCAGSGRTVATLRERRVGRRDRSVHRRVLPVADVCGRPGLRRCARAARCWSSARRTPAAAPRSSCGCLQSCAGTCTVGGSLQSGVTIQCNTCPSNLMRTNDRRSSHDARRQPPRTFMKNRDVALGVRARRAVGDAVA